MSRLAGWIRNKRDEALLTQAELARQLDIAQSTVWKWEHDQSQPTLRNLAKLRDLFGEQPPRDRGS